MEETIDFEGKKVMEAHMRITYIIPKPQEKIFIQP